MYHCTEHFSITSIVMDLLQLLEPTELFASLIICPRNRTCFRINSSKKDSVSTSKSNGLQKSSNKTLSRILRTEAAVKAVERKANSSKYNNLQPRVVLEALFDAIKENNWESALKVCRVVILSCLSLFLVFYEFLWLGRMFCFVVYYLS